MANQKKQNVAIRYDKSEVIYATQFLASPSHEELLIDFASGVIAESANQETLPIHTRLAMPWSAVERLSQILNQVVEKRKQISGESAAGSATMPSIPQASLPLMSNQSL
jgi:hypothetical protein